MRTHRRPLALAATCSPVLLAFGLLGVGLVAGASPAAAADSDAATCAATSTGPDGALDAQLLQACILDQVESSFASADAEPAAASSPEDEPAADEAPVDEAPAPEPTAYEIPSYEIPSYEILGYNPLDAVYRVDEPVTAPVEEAAPVEELLGGAFAALRECESGGDYGIDTGNGYYGAYQFSLSTWQSLGYGGYPNEASPAVQDQAASELQSLYGWSQWPGCSWYLGLG